MTELENVIVKNLIADGTVVFYARVQKVLIKLNSCHKSLNFTFDLFPDEVHFLDIKIEKNKTDIL